MATARDWLLADAQSIAHRAEKEGRALTSKEKATIIELVEEAKKLPDREKGYDRLDEAELAREIKRVLGTGGGAPTIPGGTAFAGGKSLWDAAKSAGAKLVPGQINRTQVTHDASGSKELLTAGDVSDVLERRETGVERLPFVERYVFPIFPAENVNADTGRVEYLYQSARVLAAPGDVEMDFLSTGEKPVTTSTVSLASEEPKMFANISEMIPNALFQRADLRGILDADLRRAVNESLEAHVVAALQAGATESTTGNDIVEDIVYAVQTLTDAGYTHDATVLSSTDLTTILLMRETSTDAFMLDRLPQLGTLRVSDSVPVGSPLVVSREAGDLFLGALMVDVDSFTGFTTNESRVRAEVPGLFVVKHADAVVRTGNASSS